MDDCKISFKKKFVPEKNRFLLLWCENVNEGFSSFLPNTLNKSRGPAGSGSNVNYLSDVNY